MVLQANDIAKLKKEMIIGNIISGVILIFIIVFDFFQLLQKEVSIPTLLLINILGLLLSYFVNLLINRKFRTDIKLNQKHFKTERVVEKIEKTDYEAGSGSLYIPILGDLFPKIWGQEMKKEKLIFIKTDHHLFAVDKNTFDSLQVNDLIKVYYSAKSNTYLGIEKS